MRLPPGFDAMWYRAGLYLYPSAFRREFSAQMLCDFHDACLEARRSTAASDVWRLRAHMGRDLLRSILVQWMRTGWPAIVLAAVAAPTILLSTLAPFWPRFRLGVPADGADEELLGLELLAVIVVLVIAATIVFSVRLIRIPPRTHRRRLL